MKQQKVGIIGREEELAQLESLYGRVTATREVRPFDYFDSSKFFPHYSVEEKLLAYGVLGGVPRYLLAFRDAKSIEDNISQEIVRNGAFLNDEPEMLLRMEFREPRVYNSILESIAGGHNTSSRIANRIGEERSKVSKYLGSLESIRLVQKVIPCGEPLQQGWIYGLCKRKSCTGRCNSCRTGPFVPSGVIAPILQTV